MLWRITFSRLLSVEVCEILGSTVLLVTGGANSAAVDFCRFILPQAAAAAAQGYRYHIPRPRGTVSRVGWAGLRGGAVEGKEGVNMA